MRSCLLVAATLLACSGGVTPTMDSGTPEPKLSGLPSCATVADAGTSEDIFEAVIRPYGCHAGGCHGGSPPMVFEMPQDGGFRNAMLANSVQVPGLPRVTPGDIDKSYVMYKLTGQHQDAGYPGSGVRMPFDGPPYLNDAQMCLVINWIKSGAP